MRQRSLQNGRQRLAGLNEVQARQRGQRTSGAEREFKGHVLVRQLVAALGVGAVVETLAVVAVGVFASGSLGPQATITTGAAARARACASRAPASAGWNAYDELRDLLAAAHDELIELE